MRSGADSYETGGRNLDGLSVEQLLAFDDEAASLYNTIRNSTNDTEQIAKQTGIPEWKKQ